MKVRASVKREVVIVRSLGGKGKVYVINKKILDLNRGKDNYENCRYRYSG